MPKQSSLLRLHQSNGAVFAEYDGWLLPRDFGAVLAEYQSVRRGIGLLDLSNRALLEFTGADRLSFLQGLISNDLRPLSPGRGVYAAFLSQQGKVLGDCLVFYTADSLLVDIWEPLKDKVIDHLNRYLVADEVEIKDLSHRYAIFSIQGPDSARLLDDLVAKDNQPQQPLDHSMTHIGNVEARICRCSHTGEDGFDLMVPSEQMESLARRFAEAGSAHGAKWVGEEAQNLLRIEAGIPRYGVDVTEEHLILETGLNEAVSFNKGCYLGQEVVERIRARGHVNKRLSGLVIAGDQLPAAGSKILSGDKEIGKITSSAHSPAMRSAIALGYVHRDHLEPGTRLAVRDDHGLVDAAVAQLPFVRGGAAGEVMN